MSYETLTPTLCARAGVAHVCGALRGANARSACGRGGAARAHSRRAAAAATSASAQEPAGQTW